MNYVRKEKTIVSGEDHEQIRNENQKKETIRYFKNRKPQHNLSLAWSNHERFLYYICLFLGF